MLLVLQAGVDISVSVCPQCRGDKTRCGQVAGLYTKPHLPPGVNLITTIPRGSCNLNISLLRPHNNHLGDRQASLQTEPLQLRDEDVPEARSLWD